MYPLATCLSVFELTGMYPVIPVARVLLLIQNHI